MALLTLETECPNCQVVFDVDGFDPEDPEQEAECPECGETFDCEYDGTTLTLIPFDEDEDDEDSLSILSEDDAEDDEEDEETP